MTPAIIHFWPGGGGRRLSVPGYVRGCHGWVLHNGRPLPLNSPTYSVYPETKSDEYTRDHEAQILTRTMQAMRAEHVC